MSGVHINRPSSTRYIARVRGRGCRKYTILGRPCMTFAIAFKRMARKFAEDRHWKRGDVLLVADYYDPEQIAEAVRR